MSFLTALSLSFNNLRTKLARTVLVAFAGSIGIIGIALILSLSNGVNRYIERVQRDTLSSYPLQIDERTVDMTDTVAGLMDIDTEGKEREDGKVYSGSRMTKLMSSWMGGVTENNLTAFKAWLEDPANGIDALVSGIRYEYNTPLLPAALPAFRLPETDTLFLQGMKQSEDGRKLILRLTEQDGCRGTSHRMSHNIPPVLFVSLIY